jgi:hypothetical protein
MDPTPRQERIIEKLAIRRKPHMAPEEPIEDPNRFAHGAIRGGEAARTSWLLRDAKETEIREFFKKLPLPEALSQLASARKNIEICSEILNQRISEESMRKTCTGCGGPSKRPDGNWTMNGVEKDKDTGLMAPYQYCSVECIRDRNRRRLLPEGSAKTRFDGQPEGDIR